MPPRPRRVIGEELTAAERDLLVLLCSGDDPRSAKARDQLQSARWGGYEFDDCECFSIAIPTLDVDSRIAHGGGPLSSLAVSQGEDVLGHPDLWVVDGYLRSVDYMAFVGDHVSLPTAERCTFELIPPVRTAKPAAQPD